MAYNYNTYKSTYESLTDEQRKKRDTKYANSSQYQQFMSDYNKEQKNVYTPTTTNQVTTPTTNYGDTGGAINANRYTGQGVAGTGDYQYSSKLNTQSLPSNSLLFGNTALEYGKTNPGYLEKRNNYLANALYNEGKTDEASIRSYLSGFQDYNDYDKTGQDNTVQAILNRMGTMESLAGGNTTTTGTGDNAWLNEAYKNSDLAKEGYGNLMGGGENYYTNFWDAVNGKLQKAYGIQSLDEFKSKYPEQYESLMQSLQNVEGVWNATNPNERQMLDGQLQAIIGTGVGAGSDTSKIKVLEESILRKFKDPERVKSDAQNVVKLQTEGKTISEIADQLGMSENQVQELIYLANGLDSKAGEYYELTKEAAKDITEPFDTQIERAKTEKDIAIERANRQLEWLKEDFDTTMERQKKQNDINLHNADFLAGQYGYGMSKRGIEGLNYVADQAQWIIDDLTKNYDRTSLEMSERISDIIRNWEYNNEDLMKASEDALTQAKNNYTSNMLAIQQQYGTVGMQAQQYLSQNVQSFITTAENIYDNALTRQQNNLTNLITNVGNLNALATQNLTLRNMKIQQFQSESMNLNRNQLQQLAQQLGMDQSSYQDLVNYQVQAAANELNGYVPGAGVQFQSQIQNYLNQGYTPNQALQMVMKSADFQAMQSVGGGNGERKITGDYMYNTSTGEWKNLLGGGIGGDTNYVTSQTVDGQTYGVSENTYYGLQDFMANHAVGTTGGQCGKFVNDYLQSLGLDRIFTDPITDKKAQINTPEGYKPQVGDIVIMDSPTSRKYGHVAIVTAVDGDKITTLESNKKGEGEVFSRTIDTSKQNRLGGQIFGYYHPDGNTTNASNNAGGSQQQYNQVLVDLFNKDNLTSEDKKTIQSFGMSLADFGNAKWNYTQQNQGTGQTQAEKMADAILSGVGQLPAKNSKEYTEMTIALHDKVKEIRGGDYPEGIALINYSVINDKDLTDSLSTSISSTLQSLYSTDMLIKTLEENDYKTGPILSKLAKLNPRDADYASIAADINQMSSNIARGFGEKGVLTDADIERYMKTIPNEKMGTKAREVVGTLLKAKLYDSLVKTLETQAKSHRDVSMFASDYQDAVNWLIDNGFREDPNGTIKTSNNISPIQALQNQLTGYNTQSGGRIGGNIRAGGTMQSGKSF